LSVGAFDLGGLLTAYGISSGVGVWPGWPKPRGLLTGGDWPGGDWPFTGIIRFSRKRAHRILKLFSIYGWLWPQNAHLLSIWFPWYYWVCS